MNILVGLDGSDGAFNALRTSCDIASRSRATVTAFYVNKGTEYAPEETGWAGIGERITKELESVGERVVEAARAIGKSAGIAVDLKISGGLPAAAMLNHAYDHGIVKLIAVGHSSKGRAAQEIVASTTRTVVGLGRAPVLVTSTAVHPSGIVVAVDEPGPARNAAAFAGMLAGELAIGVRILSVAPDAQAVIAVYRQIAEVPGISRHIEASQRAYDRVAEEASSAVRGLLESMALRPEAIIRRGRPAEEILAEAGREEILVVGLRSGPSGRTLGPVANRVLSSHGVTAIFV